MRRNLAKLAKRIRTELVNLEQVVARAEKAFAKSKTSGDDLYLDSVALNLQGFYSGLERLFELIASTMEGKLPQGPEWHKELLEQMSTSIFNLRPAVLSQETKERLEPYRGVRHVVRVIYTFSLKPPQLEELMQTLRPTFAIVCRDLNAFAALLEERASEK